MPKLTLTLACNDYDRTRPLMEGRVQPEGIALNYLALPVEEIFWRMCRYEEFDASEMSFGAYNIYRSRPNPPFVAIPVFPSKFFRHSCVFINAGSGVKRAEDLAGKRVGVPEYAMTAIVWMKGILADDHGVPPEKIHWFTGGLEQPGRKERVEFTPPPNVRIEDIGPNRTLNAMLEKGEIDALITARTPTAFMKGSPKVKRLWPDYKPVEMDYYRRTGCFPIMHCIAIRRSLHEAHPWVAQSLYKAFCQAKELCQQQLYDTSALRYMLPWMIQEVDEAREIFGPDIWAYGVEANRKNVETFTRYMYEQGLTTRRNTIDDLFPPSALTEFKI
ncbi:MAG: ABC transporter substrate-binding protein [Deltaproteobacteria bacterium]|nr:ABC transporter substrate-binding protein [Deltaproteobacteria bacterium]